MRRATRPTQGSNKPKYKSEIRGGIRCQVRADQPKVTYRGGIACYGFDDDNKNDSVVQKAKDGIKKFLGG